MSKRHDFPHVIVHLPRENISSLKRLKMFVMLERDSFGFDAKSILPRGVHVFPNALNLFPLAAHLPRENILHWQGDAAFLSPVGNSHETHSYCKSVMFMAVVIANALRNGIIRLFRDGTRNSYTLVFVND